MGFNLKTTTNTEDVAQFVASSILTQLKKDKKVLFFVAGGSSISVCVKISEILKNSADKNILKNLTVTLTDERYGKVGHADSNWQQIIEAGFDLSGMEIIPVLKGKNQPETISDWDFSLAKFFENNCFKIGVFGVGTDGHTAGILPESPAVKYGGLVCGFSTPTFSRITITPKAIEQFNEAVVFMQGEAKWGVVQDLLEKDIDIAKQPAQILKKVPLLTIFSGYSVYEDLSRSK